MLFPSLLLLALSLPAIWAAPQNLTPIARNKRSVPGRYIVKLKDGGNMDNWSNPTCTNYTIFNGFAGDFDDDTLNRLRASDAVAYIEEDGISSITQVQLETQQNARWGLQRIAQTAPLANKDTRDQNFRFTFPATAGEGVDIYIVDTGVRTTHDDFGGRAVAAPPVSNALGIVDGNGHGTHCAGTSAGAWTGVAKSASIVGVKVLADNGSGRNSDIIAGLDFVRTNAQSTGRPSIVSMSLGGSASNALDQAINSLLQDGIHVVVAAGNDNEDARGSSPARVPGAITVGASDIQDAKASFSNFGSVVDIFAPGVSILGPSIRSDTATAILSGTSMSCPQVAGIVATLIAEDGNVSPQEMSAKLIDLSTKNALRGLPSGTPNRLARLEN